MNAPTTPRLGRNDRCHCGSGRKYKHCCLEKDEAAARAAQAQAMAEAPAPAPSESAAPPKPPKPRTQQPWKKANTHGFQRINAPRKVGS